MPVLTVIMLYLCTKYPKVTIGSWDILKNENFLAKFDFLNSHNAVNEQNC